MTPYEHRQLRLKKEAEEKRIKEGKPPLEEKLGIEIVKHNEGTGGKPHIGARVKVHYTGKLTNGQVFDSSVSRGEPLEFVLGAGQVIKGWDEGIAQLTKGQKATLTCPPEYAYGARGAGSIPANATLIFDVELIDF